MLELLNPEPKEKFLEEPEKQVNRIISNGSLDSNTELKVRKIVQKVFRQVLESGGLSDKEIAELLDKNGSNRIFGIVHRGRFCVCVGASVCLPGAEPTCHRSTRMRKIDFFGSRPDKMTKLSDPEYCHFVRPTRQFFVFPGSQIPSLRPQAGKNPEKQTVAPVESAKNKRELVCYVLASSLSPAMRLS